MVIDEEANCATAPYTANDEKMNNFAHILHMSFERMKQPHNSHNHLVELHITTFPSTIYRLLILQLVNQHCLVDHPVTRLTITL